MAKKTKKKKEAAEECGPSTCSETCCMDAMVTVDSRGQIVLPKELRKKAKIKAGDKFAVISCLSDDRVCCISLIKAEDFAGSIKVVLSPMMKAMKE